MKLLGFIRNRIRDVMKINDKYHAKFGSYILILKKKSSGFTSSSGKDFYLKTYGLPQSIKH